MTNISRLCYTDSLLNGNYQVRLTPQTPSQIIRTRLLTFCDEEVEHGQSYRMATKHVVPTSSDTLYTHPSTSPYHIGLLHFVHQVQQELITGGKKGKQVFLIN